MVRAKTLPYEVVIQDTEKTDRLEWLQTRQQGICGSDYPQLVGLSNFGTAIDLYETKITPIIEDEEITVTQKFIFEYGHALEPLILWAVSQEINATPLRDKRMFKSTKYPYMYCNIDGLLRMNKNNVVHGIPFKKEDVILFEGKTTNFSRWSEIEKAPLPEHVAQVKHNMLVRGLKWAVIGYCKGNIMSRDLQYHLVPLEKEDEETIPFLCNQFFTEHVFLKIPPTELLGNNAEAFKKSLVSYYARISIDVPKVLKLPFSAQGSLERSLSLREEITELNQQIKVLTDERDKVEIPFVEALGTEYQVGVLDSIYKTLTIKREERSSVSVPSAEVKRMMENDPDLHAVLSGKGYIISSSSAFLSVKSKAKKKRTVRKGK